MLQDMGWLVDEAIYVKGVYDDQFEVECFNLLLGMGEGQSG